MWAPYLHGDRPVSLPSETTNSEILPDIFGEHSQVALPRNPSLERDGRIGGDGGFDALTLLGNIVGDYMEHLHNDGEEKKARLVAHQLLEFDPNNEAAHEFIQDSDRQQESAAAIVDFLDQEAHTLSLGEAEYLFNVAKKLDSSSTIGALTQARLDYRWELFAERLMSAWRAMSSGLFDQSILMLEQALADFPEATCVEEWSSRLGKVQQVAESLTSRMNVAVCDGDAELAMKCRRALSRYIAAQAEPAIRTIGQEMWSRAEI